MWNVQCYIRQIKIRRMANSIRWHISANTCANGAPGRKMMDQGEAVLHGMIGILMIMLFIEAILKAMGAF